MYPAVLPGEDKVGGRGQGVRRPTTIKVRQLQKRGRWRGNDSELEELPGQQLGRLGRGRQGLQGLIYAAALMLMHCGRQVAHKGPGPYSWQAECMHVAAGAFGSACDEGHGSCSWHDSIAGILIFPLMCHAVCCSRRAQGTLSRARGTAAAAAAASRAAASTRARSWSPPRRRRTTSSAERCRWGQDVACMHNIFSFRCTEHHGRMSRVASSASPSSLCEQQSRLLRSTRGNSL